MYVAFLDTVVEMEEMCLNYCNLCGQIIALHNIFALLNDATGELTSDIVNNFLRSLFAQKSGVLKGFEIGKNSNFDKGSSNCVTFMVVNIWKLP